MSPNNRLNAYKRELQSYFGGGHILKQARLDDEKWFQYLVDPYHQNLGLSRLMTGANHEQRITTICRLSSQSCHTFRNLCKKSYLKKLEEAAKEKNCSQIGNKTEEADNIQSLSFSSFSQCGQGAES